MQTDSKLKANKVTVERFVKRVKDNRNLDQICKIFVCVSFILLSLSNQSFGQSNERLSISEKNKEVIRNFVRDIKNRKNLQAGGDLLHQDYKHEFHWPTESIPPGLAGPMMMGQLFATAFPTIDVQIEVLIAEGDYVMERSRVTAFHGGPMAGVKGTNKNVHWTENHLYRLKDGKIIEHYPEADMAGILEQIGKF